MTTAPAPRAPLPDAEARYTAWAQASTSLTTPALARPALDGAGWRFFLLQPAPGQPTAMAGVGPDGQLLTSSATEGWYSLLSSLDTTHETGPDAERAAEIWRFLYGIVAAPLPGTRYPDPRIDALLSPARVTAAPGGGLHLQLWFVSPPDMRYPFRADVIAPPNGPAKVTQTPWEALL